MLLVKFIGYCVIQYGKRFKLRPLLGHPLVNLFGGVGGPET